MRARRSINSLIMFNLITGYEKLVWIVDFKPPSIIEIYGRFWDRKVEGEEHILRGSFCSFCRGQLSKKQEESKSMFGGRVLRGADSGGSEGQGWFGRNGFI